MPVLNSMSFWGLVVLDGNHPTKNRGIGTEEV